MTPGTDRAISAVPSVEPLSTTIISSSSDGRLCARTASRQRPIVARPFQTAMITLIKGLCIGVIFDVQPIILSLLNNGFVFRTSIVKSSRPLEGRGGGEAGRLAKRPVGK